MGDQVQIFPLMDNRVQGVGCMMDNSLNPPHSVAIPTLTDCPFDSPSGRDSNTCRARCTAPGRLPLAEKSAGLSSPRLE